MSLVLDRINKEISARTIRTPRLPINELPKKENKNLSSPIDTEKLKQILMDKENEKVVSPPIERIFVDIIDFCNWYEIFKDKFTESQQKALNTLIDSRKMIDVGCGCARTNRYNRAQDYFKTFWEQNQHTDMPKKVAELLNVKNVQFQIHGNSFVNLNF